MARRTMSASDRLKRNLEAEGKYREYLDNGGTMDFQNWWSHEFAKTIKEEKEKLDAPRHQ